LVLELKKLMGVLLLSGILMLSGFSSFYSVMALDHETILRRELEIDLGNGVITDAQFSYPSIGEGPFPGVLLIQGSGSVDMNGYTPAFVTGTGTPSKPLQQIAEYLSERGFAVLRYNKRGVGLNSTLLNQEVFMNATFQTLMQDAETALSVLIDQSEVSSDDINIIGHSEGAIIAPRIAYEKSEVKKIILLGVAAHNLRDIIEFQVIDRRVSYLEKVLDGDQDGLISIQEVVSNGDSDILLPVPDFTLIENNTGEWLFPPGIDWDGDGFLSIDEEFEPRLRSYLTLVTNPEYPISIWYRSHYALDSTLNMISNVSCSILILQGENDAQTPLSEAFLLEQRLMQTKHSDHTLKTYPGLGHTFYPVDSWKQPLGPIQEYVLSDLVAWLRDPARNMNYINDQLQTTGKITDALQGQLGDLDSELAQQNTELINLVEELQVESSKLEKNVAELNNWNIRLQLTLNSSKILTYIALGIALFTLLAFVAMYHLYDNLEKPLK